MHCQWLRCRCRHRSGLGRWAWLGGCRFARHRLLCRRWRRGGRRDRRGRRWRSRHQLDQNLRRHDSLQRWAQQTLVQGPQRSAVQSHYAANDSDVAAPVRVTRHGRQCRGSHLLKNSGAACARRPVGPGRKIKWSVGLRISGAAPKWRMRPPAPARPMRPARSWLGTWCGLGQPRLMQRGDRVAGTALGNQIARARFAAATASGDAQLQLNVVKAHARMRVTNDVAVGNSVANTDDHGWPCTDGS